MRRVLLDQGLPARAAPLLRHQGWDAVHVRETGMSAAADTAILDYAAREGLTVASLHRDFPWILALSGASSPSVVLVRRERLRAAALAALMQDVWNHHERSLDAGCVISVGSYGARVRPLPLS